jgi:hypothetical protein
LIFSTAVHIYSWFSLQPHFQAAKLGELTIFSPIEVFIWSLLSAYNSSVSHSPFITLRLSHLALVVWLSHCWSYRLLIMPSPAFQATKVSMHTKSSAI